MCIKLRSLRIVSKARKGNYYRSILNGVTVSGIVRLRAIDKGTPTWSMLMLGSGVITVLAEKSTRFPIKLPRIRPSLPFNLCLIDFSGRPVFVIDCGCPGISLSK